MPKLTRGEEKSLAVHRALVERVAGSDDWRAPVVARIEWLRSRNPASRPYYDTWQALVDGPREALVAAMVDPSPDGCSLRQESPFVDLVDQADRNRIHREISAARGEGLPP